MSGVGDTFVPRRQSLLSQKPSFSAHTFPATSPSAGHVVDSTQSLGGSGNGSALGTEGWGMLEEGVNDTSWGMFWEVWSTGITRMEP